MAKCFDAVKYDNNKFEICTAPVVVVEKAGAGPIWTYSYRAPTKLKVKPLLWSNIVYPMRSRMQALSTIDYPLYTRVGTKTDVKINLSIEQKLSTDIIHNLKAVQSLNTKIPIWEAKVETKAMTAIGSLTELMEDLEEIGDI